MKTKPKSTPKKYASPSFTRGVFLLIATIMLSTIIFDAGNLITRDAVVQRWTAASILLGVTTIVWYLLAQKQHIASARRPELITITAFSTLVFAGMMTYWERGMASTSTILYVVPILLIAMLRNTHALLATTTLAAGTYAFASVRYFNDFFNEGYRIQLWGQIVLYSGLMYSIAWILHAMHVTPEK